MNPRDRVRETSLLIYEEIRTKGLLSKMRWTVYECLFRHGPMTGAELNERLTPPTARSRQPNFSKRLSELERRGLAQRVGRATCGTTGHEAELWDVTTGMPIAPPADERLLQPKPETIAVAVAFLRKVYRLAQIAKMPIPQEFVAVAKWLGALAGGDEL